MNLRAALADPDLHSARRLGRLLAREGYLVRYYARLGELFRSLARGCPEILLMDMNMPGMDGREALRALRAGPKTRRMVLVAMSQRRCNSPEITAAFEAGADEFFFKPPDPELLVARLGSLLLRARAPEAEEALRFSGIMVCPDSRVCRVDDRPRRLTRLEFDILVQLLRNPRRVLTRGYLIGTLWRSETSRGSRAVDRHIHSLRSKLGTYGCLVETLVGVGYRLCDGNGSGLR